MRKAWWNTKKKEGFSIVEVVLASSVFGLLVIALIGAYVYGQESTRFAGNYARAALLAEEGIEAARSIRDIDFSALSDGTHGLAISDDQWVLSGVADSEEIFTRHISISSVDESRKDITCTVTWQQNPQRTGSVSFTSRLTNWNGESGDGGGSDGGFTTCNDYAISEGYSGGTCRANTNQCNNNGEDYLVAGDTYCTGGGGSDTCCASP